MGWLLRDERNMRRHRPAAQHHDPPLGWTKKDAKAWSEDAKAIKEVWQSVLCGDCGWTPEGVFELCEEHKEEDDG